MLNENLARLDKKLEKKENEKKKGEEQMKKRKMVDTVLLDSNSFSTADESQGEKDFSGLLISDFSTPSLPKRGIKKTFTPEVLTSLDKSKISNRHAIYTMASMVSAIGQNLTEFVTNHFFVRRYRIKQREER